ncbi:MAG: XRE family transcriptional regulator [Chloroflexi bacterium]|nr:XRE family transcriptional regulator [Chloroflexota bacterium]MBI2979393.1 XRE family transcriptional regulator [Chloroflexota bacterium]
MEKINYEEFFDEQMKSPEFRREYEALKPKYDMIRALIRRRNELRLSQTQLARRIGMQQPAISRLEGGGLNTTVATLFKVADALALDLEFKPKAPSKSKRLARAR